MDSHKTACITECIDGFFPSAER
ncbi:unnamed protein product, partial [Rotaria sp. Silwood2]